MAGDSEPARPGKRSEGHRGGARRLIAGLRVSRQDEALLAVVRPFFPEADSEGELAYRLWRRGLELALAEAVGLGAQLPPGVTEQHLATLAAQRLLLSVPLLRQTGVLALLGSIDSAATLSSATPIIAPDPDDINTRAADTISSLGGGDFL
jgi:hypothetical protein